MTLPNGVTASYAYDAASELTGITYTNGSSTLGALTYAYDAAGHVVGRGGTLFQSVLPGAVTSGTYDAANRLTSWNIGMGGVTPAYDANGNMTSDGSNTYSWDARNRLTATSLGAAYVYDGAGRRLSVAASGTTTQYQYDGANAVQEFVGSASTAAMLNGFRVDERFTRTANGNGSAYLTDMLGSTVALTDGSGALTTNYGYDPARRQAAHARYFVVRQDGRTAGATARHSPASPSAAEPHAPLAYGAPLAYDPHMDQQHRMIAMIETDPYLARAKTRLSEDERTAVVNVVASQPDAGVVIPGGGGIRKIRIAIGGKG